MGRLPPGQDFMSYSEYEKYRSAGKPTHFKLGFLARPRGDLNGFCLGLLASDISWQEEVSGRKREIAGDVRGVNIGGLAAIAGNVRGVNVSVGGAKALDVRGYNLGGICAIVESMVRGINFGGIYANAYNLYSACNIGIFTRTGSNNLNSYGGNVKKGLIMGLINNITSEPDSSYLAIGLINRERRYYRDFDQCGVYGSGSGRIYPFFQLKINWRKLFGLK